MSEQKKVGRGTVGVLERRQQSASDEVLLFPTLSWADAVEEAGKWIGSLHLGRVLDGQTVDLTEAVKALPFEGVFRDMVIDAACRKLKKRGARKIILPPRVE